MDLIVHHWDADGICSASLIAKHLADNDFVNVAPPVGEYRFDKRIKMLINTAESVFVADLNVPGEVEKIEKRITFFDHHKQPEIKSDVVRQINPVIEDRRAESCVLVISRHANAWGAETVIGTVGDVGRAAFVIPEIKKTMEKLRMTENQAARIAELIDSNHISCSREGVEDAVKIILEREWRDLLEHEPWIKQTEEIEGEVERVLSEIDSRGKRAFLQFRSRFNIISRVARVLVWDMGFDETLVINSDFNEKVQLYYRISKKAASEIDMNNIISDLKATGVSAGGKDDVMGCVMKPERLEHVMRVFRAHLRWLD